MSSELADLYQKLVAHLGSNPGIEGRGVYGPAQYDWLGVAYKLVAAWNSTEAATLKQAGDWAAGNLNRQMNAGQVLAILHRAVAALAPPHAVEQAFGPGAKYDFFKALTELIGGAKHDLLIVDPYLDESVFDAYLSRVNPKVAVRLLTKQYAANVKAAAAAFVAQFATPISVRSSNLLHDRVIVLDGTSTWVLGSSIKDAAAQKPTYLASLPSDVASDKAAAYESIWAAATVLWP